MNDRVSEHAALAPGVRGLGYGGVLPFVACVLGIALLEGSAREFAARALLAYGAVILSFLGAVHWGLVLRAPGERAVARLVASVLPSLIAWAALLLPAGRGLTLLAVGFGGFWLYEHRVVGTSLLAPAYLGLRRQLTLAVCALLGLGIIALG
jgi:hypothetical protein